jgi:poly-gamma-glutamate synthesis protein (capsule biosynthesis protein)
MIFFLGLLAVPLFGVETTVILTGQTSPRFDVRVTAPAAFNTIRDLLKGGDVVFTNFEGVIDTPRPGVPTRTGSLAHMWGPPVFAAMHEMGFNIVSLANNHAFDLSADGILNTLDVAKARGIAHAGTGRNVTEAAAPGYFTTTEGVKVALIAMASGSLKLNAEATDSRPGVNALRLDETTRELNPADSARILASIREAAAQAEIVIAYQHSHYWETPNTITPPWMKTWARACLDAGATIFVAHGTPLVHGLEIYRGRPIFYGLGNFIFQSTINQERAVWESFVVRGTFEGGKLRALKLRPVLLNAEGEPGVRFIATRGLPAPLAGAEATALIERFASLSREYGTELQVEGDYAIVKLAP